VLADGTYASVTKTDGGLRQDGGCPRPLTFSGHLRIPLSLPGPVPSGLPFRGHRTPSGHRSSGRQQHSSPMISRQRALFSLARYASIVHCRSASVTGDRTLFWRQETGWGSTGTANVFYSHISKAHLPNCTEHVYLISWAVYRSRQQLSASQVRGNHSWERWQTFEQKWWCCGSEPRDGKGSHCER
jgi:hypothetical protein